MNTKKSSAYIAIALLLVSTLFANGIFNHAVVSAHSGVVLSAWASVAPEIDGIIDKEEWASADAAKYETTGGIVGTFYVMNDAENLYIALTTTDSTLSEDRKISDKVWLYFDNDNDGRGPEEGDDIYGWNGYLGEHFKDGFAKDGSYSWYRDIDYGGTSDGAAAARNIERKFNSFETAHPLNSKDDTHDFSLRLEDTVGFALRLTVDGIDKGWWPSSDLAVWHDIIIASPPGGRILIDEAHNNRGPYPGGNWAAAEEFLEANGHTVEYHLTGPITSEVLSDYDVLLIAAPFSNYTEAEIEIICSFVSSGHGVFLVGEWDRYWTDYYNYRGADNLNDISTTFGITFESNTVYDPTNYQVNTFWPIIHILDPVHPVSKGVSSFQIFAGCSLSLESPAFPLAWGDDDTYTGSPSSVQAASTGLGGETSSTYIQSTKSIDPIVLLAASHYGTGGVVAFSEPNAFDGDDADSDESPDLYDEDNEWLLLNIINWLLAPPPTHDVAVISLGRYPLYVRQGDPVLVGATVENQGDFTETFDVTFFVTRKFKILPWYPPIEISIPIETRTVMELAPGGKKSLIIIWNTAGFVLDKYIIKAYAHPVPGEIDKTDNLLVDGTVELYRGIGYFIIVAGNKHGDKLDKVNGGCNEVFKTLRDVGYSGSRIYYMNQPEYYPQDVDGDGLNDIDALSTSTNLQWAIETWASSRVGPSEPLFLYLFDHGGWDSFCIDTPDTVSSTQLESWLDTLEEATNAPIHVIYAACHSGSFIEELSSTGRVTATSCRAAEGSGLAPDGTWEAFSQPFWIQIKSGHSVGWSFDSACTTVASYSSQRPLLDDNGDQTGHTGPLPNGGDGLVADSLYIGSCEWTFPWISYVVEKQFFEWPPPPAVTLWATVENETPLVHVRAWMQPPDWEPPPPDEVLIDPGFECFEMTDPDHDGTWTVDIPAVNFTNHATGPSDFKFIITAEEENGNTAISLVTGVGFTETGEPPEDNTPPSVRIERPIDMRIVHGTIRINGTAMDDVCLERVELYVDGKLFRTINVQQPRIHDGTSNSFFEFSLDTTTISNGPRTILVRAFDTSENSGYQTLIVFVNNFVHDTAVTDVTPLKTIVGQGYSMRINVTVANHGSYTEAFDVTTYANKFVIQTQTVINLAPNQETTLTVTWNTKDVDKGNYTIRAHAWPVLNETDTADNTFINSWVVVTIPGDINGNYKVDHKDLLLLARAYGSEVGDPNYIPEADINCNGQIDHKDLLILASNYGKTDP